MKRPSTRWLLSLLIPALLGGGPAYDAWGSTTMTIVPGAGFSDSTSVAPVGGNTGTTLGAQRLIALQSAADIWGAVISSSEEIRIDARFAALSCSPTSGVLGLAGPNAVFADFVGAPLSGTLYPVALANAITSSDLCPPASACTMAGLDPEDIDAAFQINIGTGGCLTSASFYYGLDSNPGPGQIDFVTIGLHELAHGLGFATFVNLSTGAKLSGFDDVYMRLLEDHSTTLLWPAMSNAQRQASAIDSPGGTSDLHWTGANVIAGGAALSAGVHSSGHVLMYAPAMLAGGSSVNHFDTSLSPDEVMEPFYTTADHNAALTADLLADIGWTVGPVPTATPTLNATPTLSATPTPSPTPTFGPLDHFTCYKSGGTSGTLKFGGIAIPPGVDLTDQFGLSNLALKKTKFLCAPTDKNGEDPTAPTHPEHLKGYQIKNPLKPAPLFPQNIQVIDQFNPTGLMVRAKKQQYLLVPAVKSTTGPTPVPTPGAFTTDHFECYNVSVVSGTPKFVQVPGVSLDDQFGPMTVDVKKPKYLCNPVDKNGEDPTAPTHVTHLMCYQVKQVDVVPFLKITGVFVNDQFGPETVDVKKPALLCVPALKNP